MNWEQAQAVVGTGFCFEVPVPLPLLGHRSGYGLKIENIDAAVLIELSPCKARTGGLSFSGGISYHDRDRFGLFASSKVQLRFRCSTEELVEAGIFEPMEVTPPNTEHRVFILMPSETGRDVCSSAFNMLVDIQTIAFGTHWVPHITHEDIHEMTLMSWTDPSSPNSLGKLAGFDGAQKFVMGRPEGFLTANPMRLSEVMAKHPLTLWEELAHAAVRDLVVDRGRSALMNACLSAENYLRLVVKNNRGAVENLSERTFKQLATRKSCLPSIIGFSLDSNQAPEGLRMHYLRIAALRDAIMHTGQPSYRWPPNCNTQMTLTNKFHYATHVVTALIMIQEADKLVVESGGLSSARGMEPDVSSILEEPILELLRHGGDGWLEPQFSTVDQ